MLDFQQKEVVMKEFLPVLQSCSLFTGIDSQELNAIIACLSPQVVSVKQDATILFEGDRAHLVGIVLSGGAQIISEDFYGNRNIVTHIGPGELFGETFACAGVSALPVSVIATCESKIMLLECHRILKSCANACGFHSRLIYNMLKVVATKNLVFHQKIEITSKRTTREKIMAYLMAQAKLHGSDSFTIPFDRQQLADYLSVERSAMSAQISQLQKDGIIECKKNYFKLL